MKYQIIWSKFSELQLDEIFDYYSKKVSEKIAYKIIRKILKEVSLLEKAPFLGQIEELLLGQKIPYRYLIISNYKIIYYVNDEEGKIKIVDVFDTRQNPTKISK